MWKLYWLSPQITEHVWLRPIKMRISSGNGWQCFCFKWDTNLSLLGENNMHDPPLNPDLGSGFQRWWEQAEWYGPVKGCLFPIQAHDMHMNIECTSACANTLLHLLQKYLSIYLSIWHLTSENLISFISSSLFFLGGGYLESLHSTPT